MVTRGLVPCALIVWLGACALRPSRLELADPTLITAPSSDVLYARDLVASTAADVYEAVMQVRPEFFRLHERLDHPLAPRGTETPRVYLNGLQIGGIDALRSIPLGNVTSVRYVSAGEAIFRWGSGGAGGAVLVTTLP
jgi:hypothetical protein